MCRFRFLNLFIVSLFLWPTLSEESPRKNPKTDYEACIDAHTSNSEWAGCGYTEIKKQEALLSEAKAKALDNIKRFTDDHNKCEGCGLLPDEPLLSFSKGQKNLELYKDSACEYLHLGGYGREIEVLDYPM